MDKIELAGTMIKSFHATFPGRMKKEDPNELSECVADNIRKIVNNISLNPKSNYVVYCIISELGEKNEKKSGEEAKTARTWPTHNEE